MQQEEVCWGLPVLAAQESDEERNVRQSNDQENHTQANDGVRVTVAEFQITRKTNTFVSRKMFIHFRPKTQNNLKSRV